MQELVSSEALNNEEEIIVFEENLKGPKGDKGDKGDDGYTPKKGVDYFTENDKQELIEAVTEDASSEFVQIVNSKTTEFNNNATSKTDSFNSNATSKETSYNENATSKETSYNENHTSKMTAYNENSAEKTAEYNENAAEKITEYDNHIEELDNIVSKNTANGESIYIDDALKYKIFDCKIDGNASQITTTGKNLLNIPDQVITNSGCTFTFEKGVCTITGTATADDVYCVIGNLNIALKAGTYTYSSGIIRGYPYFSLYYNNSWHQISVYNDNGTKTFEIDEDVIVTQVRFYFSENSIPNIPKLTPQIEQGSVATDYEEYTGGEPSPNPDYPQEITTIKDNVKLLQVGKNLFDTANKEYSLASLDINISNNELLINGTSTGSTGRFVIADNLNLKTSNYIFSFFANNIIPNLTFEFYDLEDNLCKFESANNKTNGSIVIQNHSIKKISAYSNNVQTFSHEIKLQIEEGSVATDYEEYNSNEYTIDLQDNELVKLTDDIKDEITIDKNGNVSLSKRIGKVVLNGTENWIFNESGTNYIRFTLFINDLINNQENNKKYVASDYFVSSSIDEAVTDSADANRICAVSNQRLLIKLVNDNVMNLDDFKAWLSENNVTVYYELAEPTTTSLAQLTNFKTFEGINHFFLETNISTNFEIKYAQDLQKVISKQQAEIDELKTLLSSTATSALLLDNYESDLINEIESEVEQ